MIDHCLEHRILYDCDAPTEEIKGTIRMVKRRLIEVNKTQNEDV